MSQSAGSTRYRSSAQMTSPKSQPFRSANCLMGSGRLAMEHLSTLGLRMRTSLVAINTLTNKIITRSPTGQGPQVIIYVPNAVSNGPGTQRLQPLGIAGNVTHLSLVPPPASIHGGAIINNDTNAHTSISLFNQGLVQVLQAAVTGLEPKHAYVLALT